MADKTEHYGLSLPEAWDERSAATVRADHTALDGAISANQNQIQRLQAGAEQASRNLYNLILQSYYEGKETGYQKALLFDGFLTGGAIASTSTGVWWDGDTHALRLDGAGQQRFSHSFGDGKPITPPESGATAMEWRATGNGTLTGMEVYFYGNVTMSVYQGAALLGQKSLNHTDHNSLDTFAFSIPVTAGTTYTLKATYNPGAQFKALTQDTPFGFRLSFMPAQTASGTMETISHPTTGSFQRISAWVRHSGCTPSLSCQVGSGTAALSKIHTASSVTPDGIACAETLLRYDGPAVSGALKAAFRLTGTPGTNGFLYDYGILLF